MTADGRCILQDSADPAAFGAFAPGVVYVNTGFTRVAPVATLRARAFGPQRISTVRAGGLIVAPVPRALNVFITRVYVDVLVASFARFSAFMETFWSARFRHPAVHVNCDQSGRLLRKQRRPSVTQLTRLRFLGRAIPREAVAASWGAAVACPPDAVAGDKLAPNEAHRRICNCAEILLQ